MELSFDVNGDVLQIRREGDNPEVIFSKRGLECLRVAREYEYVTVWETLICVEFLTCLKSKYLSFFSARRVFRHAGMDVRLDMLVSVWGCSGPNTLFLISITYTSNNLASTY